VTIIEAKIGLYLRLRETMIEIETQPESKPNTNTHKLRTFINEFEVSKSL